MMQVDHKISPNSSNVDEHCFQSSRKMAETILVIKVTLNSIGILASILVVCLILISKNYKRFVYRLVMYLMIVNSLQALCQILELTPVQVTEDEQVSIRNGTGWSDMCTALGFLDMVTSWMGNFIIVWIMLYMLLLSWRLHHVAVNINSEVLQQKSSKRYKETIGVLFLLFSPFLFSWIPLAMDMYGLSGLWCRIKTVDSEGNGCNDSRFANKSLALIVSLFYGPLVLIIAFVFVCMVIVILLLCRSTRNLYGANCDRYNQGIRNVGIVLIYPVIYCLFCVFLLINRIYSSTHSEGHLTPNYTLWIIHALADPSLNVIPALAFLLHPYVWKRVSHAVLRNNHDQRLQENSNLVVVVPPEDNDIENGFSIRPTADRDKYGSINSCVLSPKE
jgi:hypothetical protein